MLLKLMTKSTLPMFSSRSFMVWGLIFKSLIHLALLFVYDVTQWYNFILLLVTFMLLLFQTIVLCVSVLPSGSICCT